MPRRKKFARKPIEQYEHAGQERLNNPPVGLVKPGNDPEAGTQTYQYDPLRLARQGGARQSICAVPTVDTVGCQADTLPGKYEGNGPAQQPVEPRIES